MVLYFRRRTYLTEISCHTRAINDICIVRIEGPEIDAIKFKDQTKIPGGKENT